MENEKQTCECCHESIDGNIYFSFGRKLCEQCAIDDDPENPDYSE